MCLCLTAPPSRWAWSSATKPRDATLPQGLTLWQRGRAASGIGTGARLGQVHPLLEWPQAGATFGRRTPAPVHAHSPFPHLSAPVRRLVVHRLYRCAPGAAAQQQRKADQARLPRGQTRRAQPEAPAPPIATLPPCRRVCPCAKVAPLGLVAEDHAHLEGGAVRHGHIHHDGHAAHQVCWRRAGQRAGGCVKVHPAWQRTTV